MRSVLGCGIDLSEPQTVNIAMAEHNIFHVYDALAYYLENYSCFSSLLIVAIVFLVATLFTDIDAVEVLLLWLTLCSLHPVTTVINGM